MVDFQHDVTDVFPYLKGADLFAHAARSETFGLVILEAFAAGLPVVVADSPGGAAWIVDEGRCAELVPVDEPGLMAEAIVGILESPQEREHLSSAGRRRLDEFSMVAIANSYLEIAEAARTTSR